MKIKNKLFFAFLLFLYAPAVLSEDSSSLPVKKYSYTAGNFIWGGTVFDWEIDAPPGFRLQWLGTSISGSENIDRSNFKTFDPAFKVLQNFTATITRQISLFDDLKLMLKKPEALPALYRADALAQAVIYDETTFKVLTGKKSISGISGFKKGELAVLDLVKFDKVFGLWKSNPDIRYFVLLQGVELEGPPTGVNPHEMNVSIGVDNPVPQNGKVHVWYESSFGDSQAPNYNMVLDFILIGVDTSVWRFTPFDATPDEKKEVRVPLEWRLESLGQVFAGVNSYGYTTQEQNLGSALIKVDRFGGMMTPVDLEGKTIVLNVEGGLKGYVEGIKPIAVASNRLKGTMVYCKKPQVCLVKNIPVQVAGSSGQVKTRHLTQILP